MTAAELLELIRGMTEVERAELRALVAATHSSPPNLYWNGDDWTSTLRWDGPPPPTPPPVRLPFSPVQPFAGIIR